MKTFKDLRIIFLGTPGFAVASLNALVQAGANVVAVVTAPDKPAGRGLQLHFSDVKKYALEHGIPVLQPSKLKDVAFIEELASYEADIQVVVAFRMLPVAVWDMPPLGTINVHASLLPQYRGAAPINWAIMNGEKESGVSTFKLKHEIDTGDILLQQKVTIEADDTAGTLHDKLMNAGAELIVTTIKGIAKGSLKEMPQSAFESELKHAPKIFKEDMKIDWRQPAEVIQNHIRGLSPYPAAYTNLNGKQVKVYASHTAQEIHQMNAGEYQTDHKSFLKFASIDGFVFIDELQQEGKKRMKIEEFLRGFRAG